ncbi:hypothetical protein AC579_10322 [Pseudocercospora musae]|uniref:Uncharacterized protein n=1 Tax=Pseudocercospora musae TaxID=113226 RepID=A0A139IA27_9PEZI|nr:hypothetical protein AC579_10322 [Pseudocercospora musae]
MAASKEALATAGFFQGAYPSYMKSACSPPPSRSLLRRHAIVKNSLASRFKDIAIGGHDVNMADEAAPAKPTDNHLKPLPTLLAIAQKYHAGYEKHRLPPSHNDSKLPAIHCLEHEVINHDIDPNSYSNDREETYQNETKPQSRRHWYKPENPAPRGRKWKFCRKQKKIDKFQVFDSSTSKHCIFLDPQRDIKPELSRKLEKTKKTCIFIEEGDLTVVQQAFLLRTHFYVPLQDVCEPEDGDIASTFLGRMIEALRPWEVKSDMEMACGWHKEIFGYPKWDWKFLMRNSRQRTEGER